jgi:hypothetical protein
VSIVIKAASGLFAGIVAGVLGLAFVGQVTPNAVKPRQAVSGPQFVDTKETQASKIQSASIVAAAPVEPTIVKPTPASPQNTVVASAPAAQPAPSAPPSAPAASIASAATIVHVDSTPAPVAAETPTPVAPTATPSPASAAARWSVPGLVALAKGDLSTARLFLARAAEAGDARAWVALADTYDPAVLTKLGVVGAPGDPQRARDYLGKAAAAGVIVAKDRTAALDETTGSVR